MHSRAFLSTLPAPCACASPSRRSHPSTVSMCFSTWLWSSVSTAGRFLLSTCSWSSLTCIGTVGAALLLLAAAATRHRARRMGAGNSHEHDAANSTPNHTHPFTQSDADVTLAPSIDANMSHHDLQQQQQVEDVMDTFMLPSSASSTPPRHPNLHLSCVGVGGPSGRSSASHALANIPSSPVSPMLEDAMMGSASKAQLHTTKSFLSSIQAAAASGADADGDADDVPMSLASEERMTREDDDFPPHLWSDPASGASPPHESVDSDLMEEFEEETEDPTPPPSADPTAMTREERQQLEEKQKRRAKAAEMRYLINSVYRCRDCMIAPTDMEYGFDEHAPPRRPAARPSAGPGSEYCCALPALTEALPADFPVDLIPIMHAYLMGESPSRSFLTTPPLPSQGTIQCYILKTSTKFELYLEMKNQETFVQMRQAKEELETRRRDNKRAREEAANAREEAEGDHHHHADGLGEEQLHQEAGGAATAGATGAASNEESSSAAADALPSIAPTLQTSHSTPLPVSLDDSESSAPTSTSMPTDESDVASSLSTDTPTELLSPTHSLDYERLFPEHAPVKKMRRVIRSTHATVGQRRMSEPAVIMRGAGGGRMTTAAKSTTPRTELRRLAGSASFSAAASSTASVGIPSAVSLTSAVASPPAHPLSTSRTNAINTMLKNHAESVISAGRDIFLLCAQRKRSWTGNSYLLSSDRDNIRADGPSFLGKLKSNFGGTEFQVTDNGTKSPSRRNMEKLQTHMYPTYSAAAPKEAPKNTVAQWLSGSTSQPHVRHELACVLYDHFFASSGSPIRIKVLLPNRAFDLVTEAQVGGSIIKQYKAECERNEKRKLEAEAKAMANEEQRKRTDSRTDSVTEGERFHSESSSSAAVAPATGEITTEVEHECAVETYENLRPVWHGQN